MTEQEELVERIEEFLENIPEWKEHSNIKTTEILDLIDEGESIIKDAAGEVSDRRKGYRYNKYSRGNKYPEGLESVVDQLYSLTDVLRNRINAAHDMVSISDPTMEADSVDKAFSYVLKQVNGQQRAIDDLKQHEHGADGKPKRPF